MYRIGELARLASVTPDTIRYYEKQQMMRHKNRTEGGFRLYTYHDLEVLLFIRFARRLGFTLEVIRDLLAVRSDPDYCTVNELKTIIQTRLNEVEESIEELKMTRKLLQDLKDINSGSEHNIIFCSFFEALEQGRDETIPNNTLGFFQTY